MRDNLVHGVGQWNSARNRRDLQADYAAELALAEDTAALVDRLDRKLAYGSLPAALKSEIRTAIESFVISVRTPSSGVIRKLTPNPAATPANAAAMPASGLRPTLLNAAAPRGMSTR